MILTGTNVTRTWCDCHKPNDRARAEADNRPLALQTPIPEHPGQTAHACGQVGDDASHGSAQVSTEGRSTVEAEPSEPQEDCTEDDICGIVRLVGKPLSAIATALAKIQ